MLSHSTMSRACALNKSPPLAPRQHHDLPLNRQPQKGACRLNSTGSVGSSWRRLAVGPIPPADWGTRSTRSHLGKRLEHEIPDFSRPRAGWARGCTPFWARSPRKGVGAKWVWVRVGSWRGSDRQGTSRARGRRPNEGAPLRWAKRRLKSAGTVCISSVEATVVPLHCYCGALTNHRAQVECVAGRAAPPRSLHSRCRVWGFGPSAI
jgi:hypothetical protein